MVNKFCKIAAPLLGLFVTLQSSKAVELDWLERYALSQDRESILRELIPETEDYFRYFTLHYQTTGRLDLAEAMLNRWGNHDSLKHSPAITAFRDRQMLLTFTNNQDRTYQYLRTRLNIELNHSPPVTQQQRTYPDNVSEQLFDYETLVKQAIQTNTQLSQAALRFVGDKVLASPQKTYEGATAWWVLERLTDYSYKNLAKLVTTELQGRIANTRAFGDQNAHRFLTLDELKQLRKDVPEIANSDALIQEILMRMGPISNIDLRKDPNRRREYLQQNYQFMASLPDAFNTMKAHSLYRLLELNVSLDIYDQDLFLTYLRLPRSSHLVLPKAFERAGVFQAQLGTDFSVLLQSPPIGDEEPLVRSYLEHFLKDAKDTNAFRGLLHDDYLKVVFAETKLLYGAPDADKYFAMLSPAAQRQIKERVELQLTPLNREFTNPDGAQTLSLDVKAVPRLIVRTYKINTEAYYRGRSETINSDIDLDGLIASKETTYEYNQPTQVRHRENITLPEIQGRGVWVVDLLGSGLRCRAVVRRGDLKVVFNTQDSGHALTVLNENNDRVADAKVRLGSREFVTDKEGRTLIPFAENARSETAIVSDAALAVPAQFEHLAENLTFTAAMNLQRESLVPGNSTELVIRPQLRVSNNDATLTRIDVGTLTISAKDADGIETKRRFEKLKFTDNADTTVEFRVPENCREITAVLEAEVIRYFDGQRQTLTASQSWPVATQASTPNVNDIFLTRSGKDWIIEVRGRNGEPIVGAPIQFSFNTRVSDSVQSATTQTNDKGQVAFPDNAELVSVSATLFNNQVRSWMLHHDQTSFPYKLYASAADTIRIGVIPAKRDNGKDRFRLREFRSSRPAVDRSDAIKVENGLVTIDRLSAGDYELVDHETESTCVISVADGKIVDDFSVDNPWQTPTARSNTFSIGNAGFANGKLSVDVPGASSFTRVHVLASRYLPSSATSNSMSLLPDSRSSRNRITHPNIFISGLKLGDEYQYVLRRQTAKKFPGVILPQPSLLLNPWVIDTAENTRLMEEAGDAPAAAPMADAEAAKKERGDRMQQTAADQTFSAYDFLNAPAFVISNLKVTDGKIELDAKVLADFPIVTIIAVDPQQIVERQIFQALPDLKRRDLRLAQSFKAELNLAQRRAVRVVDTNHPLKLSDMGSAQLQIYRTIGELMPVLGNLNGDSTWSEFSMLGSWHTLSDAQKLNEYTRLACHELHLFLYVKDRAFFDKYIKTYLVNKKEKQFIDDFLLQNDLHGYLEIWRYRQLNAAEKALLAIALSDAKPAIIRELSELNRLVPVNVALERQKIESLMAGGNLNHWNKQSGLNELSDNLATLSMAGGMGGGGAYGGAAGTVELKADMYFDSDFASARYSESESRLKSRDIKDLDALRQNRGANMNFFGVNGPADLYDKRVLAYQSLELTKQWAESQWHRVRGIEDTSRLIAANRFWHELANAGSVDGFVTDHVLDAVDSRHASLVALALLNLPMSSEFQLPTEQDATIAPKVPILIASRQTIELKGTTESKKVMIGQSVALANAPAEDPTNNDDADAVEKPAVAPEYLVNTPYETKITLTNLNNKKEVVDVLWQIPVGSIALPNATSSKTTAPTDSMNLTIEPFSMATISYTFYFPSAGEFRQYPTCVSRKDQSLARGEAMTYKVVEQATQVDKESWEYIAVHGTAEQIKSYLAKANLRKIDWSRVYHRLKDNSVYVVVVQSLIDNHVVDPSVLGYAVEHRDRKALQVMLENRADVVMNVGPYFQSDVLRVDPISRKFIEHLEFSPLVVPRIHPLREKLELTNAKLQAQYSALLEAISYRQQMDTETQLAVVYFQLINNRIDEAISRFRGLEAKSTNLQIQYDYLDAYLALHQMDIERATQIAAKYNGIEIPRWKARFEEIAIQVNDYRSLQSPTQLASTRIDPEGGTRADSGDLAVLERERRLRASAVAQPTIRVSLQGDQLKIDHANTAKAKIKLYAVDLEMLFSKTPFVREGLERMAIAQPTLVEPVEFESATGTTSTRIPEKYRQQTLLVEVESGAARDTVLSYGGNLSTYLAESFGQLQVMHSQSRHPIVGAYVKVYAKHQDGSVQFFKDGYTDLRGRFDYSSISNNDLSTATRFAILVLDAENGAALHEVDPPK